MNTENNVEPQGSKKYLNVKKICPKCGTPYGDKSFKCDNCGHAFISSEKGVNNRSFWFIFALLLPMFAIFFFFKVKSKSEHLFDSYKKGLIYGSIIYFCLTVALSIYFSQGGISLFA